MAAGAASHKLRRCGPGAIVAYFADEHEFLFSVFIIHNFRTTHIIHNFRTNL